MGDPNEKPEGTGVPGESPEGREQKTGETIQELVVLKIDGADRQFTRAEVMELAQKRAAEGDRFAAAKTEADKNMEAKQLWDDFQLVKKTHDVEAFRRISTQLAVDPSQTERSIQAYREGLASPPEGKEGGERGKEGKDEGFTMEQVVTEVVKRTGGGGPKVTMDQLDPKLQGVLMKLAETRVTDVVEEALDKDPILSTIMKGGGDKRKEAIRELAYHEVKRRASSGSNVLGGQGIQDALQVVRAKLDALGIGGSGSVPFTGVGSDPGGSGGLHPSGTPAVRPKDGLSSGPEYDQFLTDRLNEELAKQAASER